MNRVNPLRLALLVGVVLAYFVFFRHLPDYWPIVGVVVCVIGYGLLVPFTGQAKR